MALTGDDPYADGSLYDLEYADHTEDVAFYVERGRAATGTVVELGCGTGRLTIPLARAGVHVWGVDVSEPMLAHLRTKLAREPADVRSRITVRAGSWTDVHPEDPPGTVLWPFNAVHHCADVAGVTSALAHLRSWVRPEATLVLDGYLLDRALYDRDPHARFEPRTFRDPSTGSVLHSWEQGWWEEATHVHHVLYVYRSEAGTERRTHLHLHMFELPELRTAITSAGWRIAEESSDFRGAPLLPTSLKWVATLTADR